MIIFMNSIPNNIKICVVYTHAKLGDLIWQLPYIKAISEHHQKKIDLIVREKTQAKDIFKDLKHIKSITYNEFRKGFYYWVDIYKLTKFFRYNKYDYVYILDKVNKPAIAARLSGTKNIIGPGIDNQKFWLTSKNFLENTDKNLNYSKQSQKFLSINNIKIKNIYPVLEFNANNLINHKLKFKDDLKIIAFGVDSSEYYKIWYEENFIELADKLFKLGLFDYAYLICGPDKSHLAKKIIQTSGKDYFIDCSKKNLSAITMILKNVDFFIGNNAGPLNLAAALGVKTFGLIANDPISELKFSKIIPITPNNYIDNIWNRDREGMKKLKVDKVLKVLSENKIIKS